ncbi:MAG: ABC transporter permease, partial [Acetobacteraceae bacterium]|nr:ABC transporter permease [Acetobacteraceae bacterium]
MSRRPWRSGEGLLVLPALLFYLAVYVYPLSRLFTWSFLDDAGALTWQHYAELWDEPAYFRALANTLEISLASTTLCLLLGYPLAYLMATTAPGIRRAMMMLVLVPFWTSILV